jgi:hypothetical protein
MSPVFGVGSKLEDVLGFWSVGEDEDALATVGSSNV